jgi:hypothetical protein
MPSLSPKDRVSLCLFSFTDGRRCRTPRISSHPHFCFYHAKKESQSQSTEKLAKDLAYFFSGDYLSANDLNTALGRLIPAVIRGEIKPRVARTVAYMLQTLLQSTRLAQHEYINAFGTDAWRETVSSSVNSNHDHLYPPDPNAPDPEDESDADPAPNSDTEQSAPSAQPQPPTRPPAPSPVGAGLAWPDSPTQPDRPTQSPTSAQPPVAGTPLATRPSPADTEAALNIARSIFPPHPNSAPPQSASPTPSPVNHTQAPAPLSAARGASGRRPHNASTNSFGTNIYTRPGNS